MKTIYLGILFMAVAVSAMADSVTFTRIQGGPPLPGVSDAETKMGTIHGADFTNIKPQIQKIIATLVKHERWLPKEAAWYDVGPDAGYMSAVVELDGEEYTINSWYPSKRSSMTIAVSETQGLVSVKSRKEKDAIEAKNTAAYREIVSIFDLIPEPKKERVNNGGGFQPSPAPDSSPAACSESGEA